MSVVSCLLCQCLLLTSWLLFLFRISWWEWSGTVVVLQGYLEPFTLLWNWCVCTCMNNPMHHFLTCYTYSVNIKGYWEINLERALDEDTVVFSFFFCSTRPDSCFCKFHLSLVTPGVFVLFFILIFCESFLCLLATIGQSDSLYFVLHDIWTNYCFKFELID